MVRGYQKRVIFLKNTGSEVFDEAYFILGNNKDADLYSKEDLIMECEKIIEKNLDGEEGSLRLSKRFFKFLKCYALPFSIGFFVGLGIMGIGILL